MTTAPVAEAADARNSLCVPDHAPEAFIKHDGKGRPASIVDNTVIIHFLDKWLLPSVDRRHQPSAAKRLSNAAYCSVIRPEGSRDKGDEPPSEKLS
jgi:hypothetical protein